MLIRMNYIKGICSNCSQEEWIVNKTYNLCDNCNHIRLHGETKQETAHRKALEYAERRKAKGAHKINQVSDKQKEINKNLAAVKRLVSLERPSECQGCMKNTDQLDRSHILSVAQRPDLQLDPRNINLFCRSCHEKWESGDIFKMSSLLSFTKDMRYIFDMDSVRYYKILLKLEDNKEKVQRISYLYDIISSFEDYFCNNFENGKERCRVQCGRCRKF